VGDFRPDNIAEFELEPALIVDLRSLRTGLSVGEEERLTDTRTSLCSIQAQVSKRLHVACFHISVGLETQMRFLFQPLGMPSEAPDI
jgi:hypothetical protein